LAEKVLTVLEQEQSDFHVLYDVEASIEEKMTIISREIYGAEGVIFTKKALAAIKDIEAKGLDKLPICVAKTQYSLSDDPTLLGRPKGFYITVRELRIAAGAGFLVALTGDVMTMPGLPKQPAAEKIDIDENGVITGLF